MSPVAVIPPPACKVILLLAFNSKLLLAEPVAVFTSNAFLIVISLLAFKVMVLPAVIPAKLPPAATLNMLSKLRSSANASVMSMLGVKPFVFVSSFSFSINSGLA